MKRFFALLLTIFSIAGILPAVGAFASAADTAQSQALLNLYTPEQLFTMWLDIGGLLRADGYYPFSELAKDDTGSEVTLLQTRLTELGYYQKSIVDTFGNGTYNAMRDFEKANGLDVNGVASAADQQALYASNAIASNGEPIASTVSINDTTLSLYAPAELLQMWEQIGAVLRANGTYPFEELEKGNVGYEVYSLQTRLAELGYYGKEIVDTFGSGTYNAMREFEQQNGLRVNGVASAADQQLLYASGATAYAQQTTTTTTTNSQPGGNSDATTSATP